VNSRPTGSSWPLWRAGCRLLSAMRVFDLLIERTVPQPPWPRSQASLRRVPLASAYHSNEVQRANRRAVVLSRVVRWKSIIARHVRRLSGASGRVSL
jgi:hypothetical protein